MFHTFNSVYIQIDPKGPPMHIENMHSSKIKSLADQDGFSHAVIFQYSSMVPFTLSSIVLQ